MQNPCVGRFNLHFCVVCSCSRESHVISALRDSKSWKSWRLDFHESRVVTTSREVIKTLSQVVPTISTTWKKRTIDTSVWNLFIIPEEDWSQSKSIEEYEVNKLKNEDGYSCFYAFVQLPGHSSKTVDINISTSRDG